MEILDVVDETGAPTGETVESVPFSSSANSSMPSDNTPEIGRAHV